MYSIQEVFKAQGYDFSEFEESIAKLFDGDIKWYEVTEFLKQCVKLAEQFYPDAGTGETKKQFVMNLWDYFDQKYDLVGRLDALVDFTKFFGTIVGGVMEAFDSKAIRAIIEEILIPSLVAILFGGGQ